MISIKNLSKCFGSQQVLQNINIEFPNKGLVVLLGSSGSGKSTLLNIIAGIITDYSGQIYVNNKDLKGFSSKKLCKYRLNDIGYVFQNFKLLNLETVAENVSLPLNCVSILDAKYKQRRTIDILEFLGIEKLKNVSINKLSGGEKQRVAIGRAIINSPSIILCDEPTGALDEKNSQQIYEILNKISTEKLVVIATHDLSAKKYADLVLEIVDGKIENKNQKINAKNIKKLPLIGGNFKRKNPRLPASFKIKHSLHKIKVKKYRSLLANGVLSIALSGIGISLLLSNSITSKIQDAFSSIFNGNQIIMSLKNEYRNVFDSIYSAPLEKVKNIKENYIDYFDGIGTTYLVNYEDFFKDKNVFYASNHGRKVEISSLSARSINDFRVIDDGYSLITYPYKPSKLEDDHLVLGLSYPDMVNLCFSLQIQRSYNSLGEFIKTNTLQLTLEVRNDYWEYDDEQIFTVDGVVEVNRSCFYQYNHLWNQSVFEKMMLIPSDDDKSHDYPWEMYKLYYLKTKENPEKFLDESLYDSDLLDFVFERPNYSYNPEICKPDELCQERRLYVFYADKHAINPNVIRKITELEPNLSNYHFINDLGYCSYGNGIMSGFTNNLYIASTKDEVATSIDAELSLDDQQMNIELPQSVISGSYLTSISNGLRFSSCFDKLNEGRKPKNLNEIVVSKGIYEKLKLHENGKQIFIGGLTSIPGVKDKDYRINKLVVVGVTNEKDFVIYHNNNWTVSFFRDLMGISMFYLTPKSVMFELNNSISVERYCNRFNQLFKNYTFYSPSLELIKSSKNTLKFATILLMSFSIIATLISIMLLGSIVFINISENKEEIDLFRYIGINKKETYSIFVWQSVIHGLIASFFSSIELVIIDVVINKALNQTFAANIGFKFSPIPIFCIFLSSIILSVLTSYLVVNLFKKR